MKFLKLIVLVSISFSLVYCSKDEISENPNNVDVVDTSGTTDPNIPTTNPDVDNPPTTDPDIDNPIPIDPDVSPVGNLNPEVVPGVNFNLSKWNFGVPIEERDGTSSDISTSQLINGYENSTYFYTGEDGAMVFKNFLAGPKTSLNTSYTRSELREMIYGTRYDTEGLSTKDLANNWVFGSSNNNLQTAAGAVDGELTATVKIDHVTTTGTNRSQVGRVIIGQIHASENEPCRLYYRKLPNNTKGSIYFAHEPAEGFGSEQWHEMIGSRNNNQSNFFDGIALGEKFSYSIKVEVNDLTVTIIREGKDDVSKTINMTNSGFANDWMYFKAGVYSQNNTGDDDDYDQVSFYELEVTH